MKATAGQPNTRLNQPGLDSWDTIATTGQPEQNSQDRKDRTGQLGAGDKSARRRKLGQKSGDCFAGTGHHKRTVETGQEKERTRR
jgi:hypothetical protein